MYKSVVKAGAEEDFLIPVNLEHNREQNTVEIERQQLRVSVWCICHIRNGHKRFILLGANESNN